MKITHQNEFSMQIFKLTDKLHFSQFLKDVDDFTLNSSKCLQLPELFDLFLVSVVLNLFLSKTCGTIVVLKGSQCETWPQTDHPSYQSTINGNTAAHFHFF